MATRATKRNASGRFERCVAKVSKRPGVRSPRGVCAAAGRKKYGAKTFATMAKLGASRKRAAAKRNAGKRKTTRRKNSAGFGSIRVGSRVTILSYHGQKQSGRAVMRGPHGWVLNLGGPHGTPGIATPDNVVKVSAPRKKNKPKKFTAGANRKSRRAIKAGATAKAAHKAKESYRRAYQTPGRGLHANKGRRKTARRKNPLEAAKKVYRKFHGRDADKVLTVTEKMHVHKYLSGIGDLVGLQVLTHDGRAKVTLKFDDGAVLAQNEKRNQLFIRGGDQSVNLKDFGITGPHHELEDLGQVIWISYYTRKDHLAPEDGGEAIYKHQFGRKKPTLIYDTVNKKMDLAGGGYDIPDEGIDK
jgi:hypothetical protein